MSIIFEDAHLKVHVNLDKNSLVTLVTFTDMVFEHNSSDYFARKPAEVLELNTIGFVAKDRNWYPLESVKFAVTILKEKYPQVFDNIITFGGSMGGYAAIKFSKLLKAKKVIAYVPQFSIEPNNCMEDYRFVNYFNKNSGGQEITRDDIGGKLYVFYDPNHSLDNINVNKIKDLNVKLSEIKLFNSGHHATTILAGTAKLQSILKYVEQDDIDNLHSYCFSINKKHDLRLRNVLSLMLNKHPVLAKRIVSNFTAEVLETYPERFSTYIKNIKFGPILEYKINDFFKNTLPSDFLDNCTIVFSAEAYDAIERGVLKLNLSKHGRKEYLSNCRINIRAIHGNINILLGNDDAEILFEQGSSGKYDLRLWRESKVNIGPKTTSNGIRIVCDYSEFICGADCMFSDNILIQSADQHGIVDLATGNIVNGGYKSIKLGDHVWLGRQSTLTSSIRIGSGSVVGTSSTVTKDIPDNSLAAGVPARVVKSNQTWSRSPVGLDFYSNLYVNEYKG